jgi:hypothetical protein
MREVYYPVEAFRPSQHWAGDSVGIETLVGWYWDYEEALALHQPRAVLDTLARDAQNAASAWLSARGA